MISLKFLAGTATHDQLAEVSMTMVLHAQYDFGINNEDITAPLEQAASVDDRRQPRPSGA